MIQCYHLIDVYSNASHFETEDLNKPDITVTANEITIHSREGMRKPSKALMDWVFEEQLNVRKRLKK